LQLRLPRNVRETGPGPYRVEEKLTHIFKIVIPVQAGQNRRERFWTAEGWPEGRNTGTYSAIQHITDLYILTNILDPGLRRDDEVFISILLGLG
jgi:hypothetical protein